MPADSDSRGNASPIAVSVIVWPGEPGGPPADLQGAFQRQTSQRFEVLQAADHYADGPPNQGKLQAPTRAMAMNLCAARASGRILAFIAPDLEPRPDWIEAIEGVLGEHPGVDAVAGRTLLQPGGPVAVAEAALEARGSPAEAGEEVRSSLHCAVRREAFARAGGFDEVAPDALCAHTPMGGFEGKEELRALTSDRVIADRHPCPDVPAFVRRRWAMGVAACHAPRGEHPRERLADGLEAPGRALALARHNWERAPALLLVLLGLTARFLGAFSAFARGGRLRRPLPSPLMGPESAFLVPPGRGDPVPAVSVIVP
ncbi:MAG: glycosyltransferase family protein, partial [Planctomycetota bacterium]